MKGDFIHTYKGLLGVQSAKLAARQLLLQEFLCNRLFAISTEEISYVARWALFCR